MHSFFSAEIDEYWSSPIFVGICAAVSRQPHGCSGTFIPESTIDAMRSRAACVRAVFRDISARVSSLHSVPYCYDSTLQELSVQLCVLSRNKPYMEFYRTPYQT